MCRIANEKTILPEREPTEEEKREFLKRTRDARSRPRRINRDGVWRI